MMGDSKFKLVRAVQLGAAVLILLLIIFRPNLSDRQPPVIEAETDWLRRLGRKLAAWIGRWVKLQEPMTQMR